MSGPGTPPPGWDEIPQEITEAARSMRVLYLSLMSVGFTMGEACAIIGGMLAAGAAGTNLSTP